MPRLKQQFIELDVADIDCIGDTICSVILNRRDGKVGRANFRLASDGTKVKASVSTISLDGMTEKTITVRFVWSTDEHGDLEYPPGDSRRRS